MVDRTFSGISHSPDIPVINVRLEPARPSKEIFPARSKADSSEFFLAQISVFVENSFYNPRSTSVFTSVSLECLRR
jgi:hypothetical protein